MLLLLQVNTLNGAVAPARGHLAPAPVPAPALTAAAAVDMSAEARYMLLRRSGSRNGNNNGNNNDKAFSGSGAGAAESAGAASGMPGRREPPCMQHWPVLAKLAARQSRSRAKALLHPPQQADQL